jgi:acetyl-CoA C-acetyltransferase
MGVTAENLAREYGISRELQDAYALSSQQKARAAIDSGRFRDEIVPVSTQRQSGESLSWIPMNSRVPMPAPKGWRAESCL